MGRVASTVAGLGTPIIDGEIGVIEVAGGHREVLNWNAAQKAWIGKPRYSMRQIDTWGMISQGPPSVWIYPFSSSGLGGVDTGYGFQIHAVRDADLLWNAGLRLQENLTAAMRSGADGVIPEMALTWYDLDPGDNFLSPTPTNQGVHLVGEADASVLRSATTGWQNSPVAAPTKNWYPELYTLGGNGSIIFERFTAQYRWVGGTLSGGTAGETSYFPPIYNKVGTWLRASTIPRQHNEVVDTWPDYGGRGFHMKIRTGTPVLKRGVPGDPEAYVYFDGVDDALQSVRYPNAVWGPPSTLFMILRQRPGGSSPQMWVDASTLLYRGSDTDQVNVWAGGGPDVTYNRGSNWPMPFTIISVTTDGTTQNIWENNVPKASGNSGSRGFGDFTIGTNNAGTYPAAIDVAELLVYDKALNDTERTQVLDWLNTVYNLY